MKKNNYIWAKLSFGLGVLLILSYRMGEMAGNNKPLSGLQAGFMMVFGSIAYMARRYQIEKPSLGWRILEIISIIFVLYLTLIGIISGAWYTSPLTFMIIPIWSAIAYAYTFRGRTNPPRPINKINKSNKTI